MQVYILTEWYPKEFMKDLQDVANLRGKDEQFSSYSVVGVFSKKKFAKYARSQLKASPTVSNSTYVIEEMFLDFFSTHSKSYTVDTFGVDETA